MRPEFGCAVHDVVFDTIDAAIIGAVQTAVYEALERWEPRIEVTDVEVTAGADQGVLHIDVRYAIRGTNNPRSLVFPFYVIPSHDTPSPEGPEPGSAGGPATESDL